MRIIQLTPGTGSFYCGTCLRDNALVAALRKQGHDALMIPLYLPPALDEEAATANTPVFYGGINVYLQQKSSLFRKTPRWVDSVFDSPPMLKTAASRAGMTTPDQLGDLTLSTLRGENGNQVKELERLAEWLKTDGKADVICLSNALLMGLARRIKEQTGAAVVCTLQGEDYFLDLLPEPYRTDSWNTLAERAPDVDAFIAVSRYYGDTMQRRAQLPPERVHVVYNGILLDGYPTEPTPRPIAPPVLGFLSRMCSLKGLETLVEAYILLRANNRLKNLKLRIAGTRTAADEAYVARLQARLKEAGLESEVEFLPNISRDEKIAFLKSLSVLSVPATYGESFGLYILEALAAGVPVVQPRHAAFPEVLEQTGGGVLCEPDDPASLAAAIENLLCDPEAAQALGEAGRKVVHKQFHVGRMAKEVAHVFEKAMGK
jgi:glycosyltransferase involved in cell wall biosynthesis